MNDNKKGIIYRLNQLENHILVFGFVVVIAVGFLQVVMRTIFNRSLTWSEELIRYIYIWLCWVGISLCERRNEHIQLTFVLNAFPVAVQKLIGIVIHIGLIFFTAWLTWLGFQLVGSVYTMGTTSTALNIPMYLVYLSFPIGCLLYCIRVACKLPGELKKYVKGKGGGE